MRDRPTYAQRIAEQEAKIEALEAEINSSDCSACRRKTLRPRLTAAKHAVIRLRRQEALAAARAADAAESAP
jgi:hypothetical protein